MGAARLHIFLLFFDFLKCSSFEGERVGRRSKTGIHPADDKLTCGSNEPSDPNDAVSSGGITPSRRGARGQAAGVKDSFVLVA